MSRPKRSLIDQALEIYRQMEAEERAGLVMALRGFDAAVKPAKLSVPVQRALEELGERAAEQ